MKRFIKFQIIILLNISLILLIISCSKESKKSGPLPADIALQSAVGLQVGVAMANITPDNPTQIATVREGVMEKPSVSGVRSGLVI